MSSEEGPVAWLRKVINQRLYLARHAIELGNASAWTETSSGVLIFSDGGDTWDGVWASGDSSVTRLMEANDPQDTIARCEAELAILDGHPPMQALNPLGNVATWCAACQQWPAAYPCRTICLLASAYKHWPGYREV